MIDPAPPLRPAAARLAAAGLALLVALVFWPALGGELVYDDLEVVAQNPALRSAERLPEALGAAYWDFLDADSAARIGYWRPLTTLALFTAQQLGGGATAAFHGLALALHALACVAAFLLVRRLVRDDLAGFCAALLFALHPLHVEPVAWISAISDPLQGLLVLCGLLAHLRWREAGSEGRTLVPALCFALALTAKESAIAFLPLVAAVDLGRRRADDEPQPIAAAYAPLFALIALYVGARMAVFGDWRAGFDRVSLPLDLPFSRMLALRAEFFGGALELLAWPARLNLFRELRPEGNGFDAAFVRALIWIAVWVVGLIVCLRRGLRPALLALLLIPAALLPFLLRLEAVGRFPLSDRFLYLAVLGAALLATLALFRWLPRPVACAVAVVLAGLLGMRARSRLPVWADELTLFRHAVAETPDSMYTRWGLGRVLLGEFQRTGDSVILNEALDQFALAQDIASPPDGSAPDPRLLVTGHDILQANLGIGWFQLLCASEFPGRCSFEEAELVFRATLERFPTSELAMTGLGVSLMGLERHEEAEALLFDAVDRNPHLPQAWFHLGRLAAMRGEWEAAATFFEQTLELTPGDVAALAALGEARLGDDRVGSARRVLEQAYALDPDDVDVLIQLGALEGREGHMNRALGWLDRALALDDERGDAHLLRAKALLNLDDLDGAVRALQEACTWSPNSFEAYYNLGVILLQNDLPEQAVDYLRHALKLDADNELSPQIRQALSEAGY